VSDVTGGKVSIHLKLLSMIKVDKDLDLCQVLQSDVMKGQECPLSKGDVVLDASGKKIHERKKFGICSLCLESMTS
jgi:hypothetical protein